MCLAVPARICEMPRQAGDSAVADVFGARRRICIDLLAPAPVEGDWVLVHVGIALARLSETDAREQLDALARLGEAEFADDNRSDDLDPADGGP